MLTPKPPQLERSLSLMQATAINMIDMVGIGPFIVLPLVIKMMGGAAIYFCMDRRRSAFNRGWNDLV